MALNARGNPARWWKTRSCGSASRAPGSLFISPSRRNFGLMVLGLLLTFFTGLWYITNTSRISRLSEVLLSKALGGQVTVKGGRLSWSGTLLLSGVDLRTADPEAVPGGDVPIFSAEQVEARFDWLSLLSGQLSATQLVATRPVFRPIEDRATGHWNYERLRPPVVSKANQTQSTAAPGAPPLALPLPFSLPVVLIHNARVEWGEVKSGEVIQTGQTLIDGRLTPDPVLPSTYRMQFAQLAPDNPGNAPSDFAPALEIAPRDIGATVTGTWDVAKNSFSASTDNVVISETLKRGMPGSVRQFCEEHQFNGRLLQLKMSFNARDGLSVLVQFDGVSLITMIEPEQGIVMGEYRPAYPLTINNVRGTLVFLPNSKGLQITDLRGEVLGYPFAADAAVSGNSFDAPFKMNVSFPGAVLSEPYPPLFMAFLSSQDLIQRIRPQGKMDIGITLHRLTPFGPVKVDGVVDCHDVHFRFAHLPYPLDHLNGRVTFDQQSVTFHNVSARSDENVIGINGTVGTVWNNPAVDLTVSSDATVFEDRLGASLPQKFATLWDSFAIRATGGFVCRVTRSNSFFDTPKVEVDVTIRDGKGYMKALPYMFTHASGKLHFAADETRIDHLTAATGSDGSGRIMLDGIVHHADGDVANLVPDLRISADVPIEPRLIQALPEEVSHILTSGAGGAVGGIELGGRLGFDGTVKRSAAKSVWLPTHDGETMQLAGAFTWKNGTLKTIVGDVPINLEDITASLAVTPEGIDVRQFSGALDVPRGWCAPSPDTHTETAAIPQHIELHTNGRIDLTTLSAAFNVAADTSDILLPAQAPAYFPKALADLWKDYTPAGRLGVQAAAAVRINAPATASGPARLAPVAQFGKLVIDSYQLSLAPADAGLSIQYRDWPEPMDQIKGSVAVRPTPTGAAVDFQNMTARVGVMDLAVSGQLDTATGMATLKGDVKSLGLPLKWLDRLPEGLAKGLQPKPAAATTATTTASAPATVAAELPVTLTLHLDELTRQKTDGPWQFNGTLSTTQLALNLPFSINAAHMNIVARGDFTPAADTSPAALNFNGIIAATDMLVSDHLLPTFTTHVQAIASEHAIHFTDIQGMVAGGQLQGRINVLTQGMVMSAANGIAGGIRPEGATGGEGAAGAAGGYDAQMSLTDADLAHLVLPYTATDEDRKKMGTGLVNATLSVREVFATPSTQPTTAPGTAPAATSPALPGYRTGEGNLTVRDANIYNVPIAMGLMQVATLRLPVARSFKDADLSYTIQGDDILFNKILLTSAGINLAGQGRVSITKKELDLNFVTGTPDAFRIPVISDLFSVFQKELLQLSVTGTLDNPKINPVPLSALSNALRALLPGAH